MVATSFSYFSYCFLFNIYIPDSSGVVRPAPVMLVDNEQVGMTLLGRTLQMGIVGRKAGMIMLGP